MKLRLATLAVVVAFLMVFSLALLPASAVAQNGSFLGSTHAVSPPLIQMPPVIPQFVQAVIPLGRPYAAGGNRPGGGGGGSFTDADVQTVLTGSSTPGPSNSFLGAGVGLAGILSDQYAPPDTNGAAGKTNVLITNPDKSTSTIGEYVQAVNVWFTVFNKATGAVVHGPVSATTLFANLGGSCATYNGGDSLALYDKGNDRWVLSQIVYNGGYDYCVAVSTSNDAAGTYNLYAFSFSALTDYPKMGVWSDGNYYVTFNMFKGSARFIGPQACQLPGAAMRSGQPATPTCQQLGTSYASLLPADLDSTTNTSSSTPEYFVSMNGSNALYVWRWRGGSTPLTAAQTIATNNAFQEACGGGTCVPQLGTSQQLDSLGDRLMYRFAYRNFGSYESLVVSHSVNTGKGYTGIRWYELRNQNGAIGIAQESTYAPDANYRWMPSMAQDKDGDMAIGYSVSSSSMYPGIRYAGRLSTDSSGLLDAEAILMSGGGSQLQNLNRWGDYSAMTVDPDNDCTFWFTTEYLKTSGTFNWSTQIGSFKYSTCQ